MLFAIHFGTDSAHEALRCALAHGIACKELIEVCHPTTFRDRTRVNAFRWRPLCISTYMDLLVFSHLRWDFVYQRPQHLISRFAAHNRVWFWEEPLFGAESRR